MGRNEFGVESSNSGGFGAGAGDDFEDMFEEAISHSVVDDEVSEPRRRQSAPSAPVAAPLPPRVEEEIPFAREPEPAPSFTEPSFTDEPSFDGPSFSDTTETEPSSFGTPDDLEGMFSEAEDASLADDEVREPVAQEEDLDSFDSFGADEPAESFNSFDEPYSDPALEENTQSFGEVDWVDPVLAQDPDPIPAPSFSPEPVSAPSFEPVFASIPPVSTPEPVSIPAPEPVSAPAPASVPAPVSAPVAPAVEPEAVYYTPTVTEPRPSVVPDPSATVSAPPVAPAESDVDYIESVILTSDAIRELDEVDAKAVNMVISAGQPVDSHQELVLTALRADRQILKTSEAILEAKEKSSVDRAFHILGLDDATFVDFGKILSHYL